MRLEGAAEGIHHPKSPSSSNLAPAGCSTEQRWPKGNHRKGGLKPRQRRDLQSSESSHQMVSAIASFLYLPPLLPPLPSPSPSIVIPFPLPDAPLFTFFIMACLAASEPLQLWRDSWRPVWPSKQANAVTPNQIKNFRSCSEVLFPQSAMSMAQLFPPLPLACSLRDILVLVTWWLPVWPGAHCSPHLSQHSWGLSGLFSDLSFLIMTISRSNLYQWRSVQNLMIITLLLGTRNK